MNTQHKLKENIGSIHLLENTDTRIEAHTQGPALGQILYLWELQQVILTRGWVLKTTGFQELR